MKYYGNKMLVYLSGILGDDIRKNLYWKFKQLLN